jgi:hypothetical protein
VEGVEVEALGEVTGLDGDRGCSVASGHWDILHDLTCEGH